ncbi:MAG: phosphate signaling complex protein PhoU [Thermoanaerobaculales bacterium]|jgi:phosphate transport system protein|nr:phosphate signaling complex protein PhoU [Thermoanaerobaculales bacterium]
MHRQFEAELDEIKRTILTMAGLVERCLVDVARALTTGDAAVAESVIAMDDEIDQYEVTIDRLATEFIARHQPTATDLRFVIVAIKLGPELERVADNAVNIAERVRDMDASLMTNPLKDLLRMLGLAQAMVNDAIAAYVARDAGTAREIIRRDDEVDSLYWQLFRELLHFMVDHPDKISRAIDLILMARFVERIADQATNISEQVVYLVEAREIRHVRDGGSRDEGGSS